MQKIILICFFTLFCVNIFAEDPSKWTDQEVKSWYEKKEWANGCPYELDSSISIRKFAISYFAYQKEWDEALAFFKNNDLQNLELKRYEIDGDKVFANVSDALTRDYDKTNCEFHLKIIDIQFAVRGTEGFGISQQVGSTIVKAYDLVKDVMLIKPETEKVIASTPTRFFVFFPGDPHRPNMTVGDEKSQVKKVVVKIKTE